MVTAIESQHVASVILAKLGHAVRAALGERVARALDDGRGGVELHLIDGRRVTVALREDGRYEVSVVRSGVGAGELRETVLRLAKGVT